MIKKLGIGCGGLLLLFIVIGVATSGSQPTSTSSPTPTPARAQTSPAATATPTAAGTPAPVSYEVLSRGDFSVAGRTRTVVNVTIAGDTAVDQRIATLAELMRRERKPHVVVAYAYRSAAEAASGPYTVAAAMLSSDQRGWTGDGTAILGGPDEGRIVVWARSCSASADVTACIASTTQRITVQP